MKACSERAANMKTVPLTPYTDRRNVTKCGRTMGPTPVIVHENPAAFLRLFLKYVLIAKEEADTLMPMPKPKFENFRLPFLTAVSLRRSYTYQKVKHMKSYNL